MNWKTILLGIGITLINPITLTTNELADHYDKDPKTEFNADYVVRAWGNWLVLVFGGGVALMQRKEDKSDGN